MKDEFNIIIAGVGGQGILTLAAIIARAALIEGKDVKASELHGLAMRFGPVDVQIKFGKKILSPLIANSDADIIIGLEPLEALRACRYAKKDTVIITDTKKQIPVTVHLDKTHYPSFDEIKK